MPYTAIPTKVKIFSIFCVYTVTQKGLGVFTTMVRLELGYACINTALRNGPPHAIFCSRTITLKRLSTLGEHDGTQRCIELAQQNLRDVLTILQWNEANNIRFFRLTSNLFPHVGNRRAIDMYPDQSWFSGNIDCVRDLLVDIGRYVRTHGHRITFHANPYVQLGTPNADVLAASLFDIRMHYTTFTMMGLVPGQFYCLIVHGGGTYGDKSTTLVRTAHELAQMDPAVRAMLVYENDEWHYTPLDLLPLCERFGLGFCFDIFHNRVSRNRIPVTGRLLHRIIATWTTAAPKMHISEQRPGDRRGSHSDLVHKLPSWIYRLPIPELYMMLECKLKEQSIFVIRAATAGSTLSV